MDLWTLLRLIKFLGILLFAAGVGVATLAPQQAARRYAAWSLVPGGFFLTWVAGYGLLKSTGRSMGEPWISLSMLASLVALQGALGAAERGGRGWLAAAWGGLGAATAVMVSRGPASPLIGLGVGLLWAVVGLRLSRATPGSAAPSEGGGVPTGFWEWTRAEALSAAALFLLYMPLKYGAGIVLDGGQGWFGWVHGVLTILFVSMLPWATGPGRLSRSQSALALGLSFLPLGGFWFERRAGREG